MMSDIKNGSSQCYSGYALVNGIISKKMKKMWKWLEIGFFFTQPRISPLSRSLAYARRWSAQLFTLEREERKRAFGGIWRKLRGKLFHLVCLNVTFISSDFDKVISSVELDIVGATTTALLVILFGLMQIGRWSIAWVQQICGIKKIFAFLERFSLKPRMKLLFKSKLNPH